MEHLKELLSAKETTIFLGMSRTTLWRRTRSGALPAPLRVAGLTRWRRSELLAFLDEAGASRDRCAQ